MAKESTYSTATPTGTDWLRGVGDPTGTPTTENYTVESVLAATNGATVYRIWDGMSDAINTVWQNFWAETAKAVLIIEPKASGVYTLNNDAVECTSTAATVEKYVYGNNQEVYTATGSLLWRGSTGATNTRKLFLYDFFFSAPGGNAGSSGAGICIQNPNWNVIQLRSKYTAVVVGTHTAGGQAEFNWMRFDLSNCEDESPLRFVALSSGDGSMRGNQIHARIFKDSLASPSNAFRCSMNLYHSEVEIHAGGFGGTGGTPGANPNANYTGADAVFWWDNDGATDNSIHGARIKLRSEKGSGTGKVGLWFEDNGSARRQEHGHISFATTYAYDYMAVADFVDPSELPRFDFGINQQTQVNSWTADDGSWKVPVMRWDGGRYNITDVPGVFADGVTDVDSLIGTALSNGGAWYFPPGNYHLGAGVNITHTTHLDVECANGVLFSTNGEAIDDDLFDFDTNVTDNDLVDLRWHGGTFNAEGVLNSTSLGAGQAYGGYFNGGSVATASVFDIRDGYWRSVTISGAKFYNRTDGHVTAPESLNQHWQGDLTNGYAPGADSGIFANSGPGTIVIEDCDIVGFKDAGIYISGQGNSAATPPSYTQISRVRVFHCADGIALKQVTTKGAKISDCYAYNCGKAFFVASSTSNAGADEVVVENCVARQFRTAFDLRESDRCRVVNPTAIDPWLLDWTGSTAGLVGSVTITSDTDSTTITGITVDAIQVMSGTVTQSGTGAAARKTFAQAVASNINAHTSTPDYKAGAWFDGTNWTVFITTTETTPTAANGDTVASAGTATTTDSNLEWFLDAVTGVDVLGCLNTRIDGPHFTWDSTTAATVASARGASLSQAFRIRSRESANTTTGVDIQTLDTYITNAVLDGIQTVGGEEAVAGVTEPDRTRVLGLLVGDGVTDASGFTLVTTNTVASSVDYQDVQSRVLASNQTIDSATYETLTGFSVDVRTGATYMVEAFIVYDALETVDIRVRGDVVGGGTTMSGYFRPDGRLAAADTGNPNSDAQFQAVDWTANSTSLNGFGGIGQTDANDILGANIFGVLEVDADDTFQLEAREAAAGTDATIYAGSWMRVTRIA